MKKGQAKQFNNILSFLITVRNLSNVQRLSTYKVGKYSVAEHSLYTAVIAILLCEDLWEQKIEINWYKVINAAILHDLPECLTGDILHVTKKFLPKDSVQKCENSAMRILLHNVPKRFHYRLKQLCFPSSSFEEDVVKFADMCELGVFIYEENKSNTSFRETGIYKRVIGILKASPVYKKSPLAREIVRCMLRDKSRVEFV